VNAFWQQFAWATLGVASIAVGTLTGAVPLVAAGGTMLGGALLRRPGDEKRKR